MASRETKTIALTVAASLVAWGVQQATTGQSMAGGIGIAVGLAVMFGYQFVEDQDHEQAYNDVVSAIGEDTLKQLSETSADTLTDLADHGTANEEG